MVWTRRLLAILALSIGACGGGEKAKEAEAPADAEATEATPASAKAELAELEAELVEIGKQKADAEKRRELCLSFEPKVDAKLVARPTDVKLQQFGTKLSAFCGEATEARRKMKKAAEPLPAVPELSASMKSGFTASLLKSDLGSAKALVKKGGNPEEICRRLELTGKVVAESKKKDKKTKKLLKEAAAFCEGPAVAAGIRFHEEAAKKAEAEEQPASLAEHCTIALVKIQTLPAGKVKDGLEAPLRSTCREVYALRELLKPAS